MRAFRSIVAGLIPLALSAVACSPSKDASADGVAGQDAKAQTDLRNAYAAAARFYTDDATYPVTAAQLNAFEPRMSFDPVIANASTGTIGFSSASSNITFVTQSKSGTWFCIVASGPGGVTFGKGVALTEVDSDVECADASW